MVPASSSQQSEAGWEVIIGPYDRWLRRRVRQAMRRKGLRAWSDDIPDYVQEIYCRLLEGGPQRLEDLRRLHAGKLFVYLGKVADGVVHDKIRSVTAIKRWGDERHAAHMCNSRKVDLEDPERLFLRSERYRLLMRHLLELGDAGRISKRNVRILWLAVIEEWKNRDIARALRIQTRTVDTLVSRLRRRYAMEGLDLRLRARRYDAA